MSQRSLLCVVVTLACLSGCEKPPDAQDGLGAADAAHASDGATVVSEEEVYRVFRAAWMSAKRAKEEGSSFAPSDAAIYAVALARDGYDIPRSQVSKIVQKAEDRRDWRAPFRSLSFESKLAELQDLAAAEDRMPTFEEYRRLVVGYAEGGESISDTERGISGRDRGSQPGNEAARARCRELNRKVKQLTEAGRYTEAARLAEEAVEASKAAFGPESPEYAIDLGNLASLYMLMHEYAKAKPPIEEATAIEKLLGDDGPNYAVSLRNLATLYLSMGEYGKAEPLFLQALAILKRFPNHRDYATCLINLGHLYELTSEYGKAESLYQQATKIRKRLPDQRDYAASLSAMGVLYMHMGEFVKAEPLIGESLAIRRKLLGKDHPDYAASLVEVGGLHMFRGEYTKAQSFLERASEILKMVFGEEHPQYGAIQNNLAGLYLRQGSYILAEALYRRASATLKKTVGENHPDYALSLANLGSLYLHMGDYASAEPLCQEAARKLERAPWKNRHDYARCLSSLARLHTARDASEKATAEFDRALQVLHGHTTNVLRGVSERRQVAFVQHAWYHVELFLSFIHQEPGSTDAAFRGAEWLARWKALGAEVQTERARLLRESQDPKLQDLVQEVEAARKELAQWTISPPAYARPEEVRKRREAAEAEVERLDSRLAQQSARFAELGRVGRASLADVAAALPADGVLLDYVKIHDFNFKAKGTELRWDAGRYLVFLTAAGEAPQPVLVDLGPAKPIDEKIAELRDALRKIEGEEKPEDDGEVREILTAIRKLIVDPAFPQIREKNHWIICPDGQISLVPFESLPITDGSYLIEVKKVSYLGAGREAVAYARPPEASATPAASVLLGNPDFDLPPDAQRAELRRVEGAAAGLAMRGVGGSRELREVIFKPLPATGQEVKTAARLIGGREYIERRALEAAVKQASRPDVLYLATHGFYLPDQERDREAWDADPLSPTTASGVDGAMDNFLLAGQLGRIENPLLRCGLALAGANQREVAEGRDDIDDGILTGMEVAGLDLWGTKLVVLSACQTGMGDLEQGEGVVGLRRVFFLAGSRRVVSALWMVPDRQTLCIMTDFIAQWQAGSSGVDALRGAQIGMIEQMRKQYGHAHPFYWAAFTMTGDWR